MPTIFDRIDPEARRYLKKVFKTMAYSLLWMFANVIFGFALQLAYVEGKATVGNILYYVLSVAALILLVIWLVRAWGRPEANIH